MIKLSVNKQTLTKNNRNQTDICILSKPFRPISIKLMASTGDDDNEEVAPPPQKKRKLTSMFSNSFVANSSIFDELEDVTFIVGNKETGIEHIGGNRTIFSIQSNVFQAQLFGKMAEAKTDKVVIEDITPQAFTFLKNLFYVKDHQQLTVDIVLDVLYASKKYLLVNLECECYKFIENITKLNDWWKLISQQKITTDIDMDDALIRKSQVLIKNSNKIVKDSEKLLQLTPQWLAKLVQSSSFVVDDETIVWEMCVKYCQDKVDIAQFMGNSEEKSDSNSNSNSNKTSIVAKMMNEYFVQHIRFSIMDRNYFFNKIEKSGILDGETKYDICKCCLLNDAENRKNKYNSRYTWYPRKPYDQIFLAKYDIRMLSKGDKILVTMVNGELDPLTIESIDWESSFRNGLGANGLKYTEFEFKFNRNCTLDELQNGCYWSSINGDYDMVPLPSDVKKIYSVGDRVEMRILSTKEWLTGVIESIPDEYHSAWKPVIKVKPDDESDFPFKYFHPWNFACLRPLGV